MDRFNFQTKSDVIYQELKRDIVSGKYKPRERSVQHTAAIDSVSVGTHPAGYPNLDSKTNIF